MESFQAKSNLITMETDILNGLIYTHSAALGFRSKIGGSNLSGGCLFNSSGLESMRAYSHSPSNQHFEDRSCYIPSSTKGLYLPLWGRSGWCIIRQKLEGLSTYALLKALS